MDLYINYQREPKEPVHLAITGSKSESNRLLILQALFPTIEISNLSNSDDTRVLQAALSKGGGLLDIHHAGTAMRFLTAYMATRDGVESELTGSERMKQRPISLLVDALRSMGASIEYLGEPGCPPLKINGRKLTAKKVSIAANISSQYISALMLIGAGMEEGLTVELEGELTSRPYLLMTLELMQRAGIRATLTENQIQIQRPREISPRIMRVESDWSSASYFFSLVALSDGLEVHLTHYRSSSIQGDSALVELYRPFGVRSNFDPSSDTLKLSRDPHIDLAGAIDLDLSDTPDLAQTLAVTCLGLGIGCRLRGLHTLKIKETDRLVALKTEIEKFGARVEITGNSLRLFPVDKLRADVTVDTYNDHRMAMAFAPLGRIIPFTVNEAEVVSKSYPGFWEDMGLCGLTTEVQE